MKFNITNGLKVFTLLILGMALFHIANFLFKEIQPHKLRYSISLAVYISYCMGMIACIILKIHD